MSINRANQANHVESSSRVNDEQRDDGLLTPIAARLDRFEPVSKDALGAIVVNSGGCMDALPNGDRPGWLFDEQTPREIAVGVCARCPVADACLELELRLFGTERLGMWGALGERGRRELHPVWQRRRAGRLSDDTSERDGGAR
jgi:WhiB family redox-sensing transcriptional regulator